MSDIVNGVFEYYPLDELKPCPFCGYKPVLLTGHQMRKYDEYGEYVEDDLRYVYCKRCDFHLYHNGPYHVVQRWNTRADPKAVVRAFWQDALDRDDAERIKLEEQKGKDK